MIDTGFLIAVVGAVLAGASLVLHVVAPRTRNTIDDQLRDDLDEVLAFIRGQQPPPTGTAVVTPSAHTAPSSAGTVATVALLAAMIGGVSLAPACHTLGPAVADGLVAALDCEAQHFTMQLVIDSTHFADSKIDQLLADAAAPSPDTVEADLKPFDTDAKRCALFGLMTGATSAAGSAAGSNSTAQGLTARASIASAAGDPVQVRAAIAAAARGAGWQIKGWTVP